MAMASAKRWGFLNSIDKQNSEKISAKHLAGDILQQLYAWRGETINAAIQLWFLKVYFEAARGKCLRFTVKKSTMISNRTRAEEVVDLRILFHVLLVRVARLLKSYRNGSTHFSWTDTNKVSAAFHLTFYNFHQRRRMQEWKEMISFLAFFWKLEELFGTRETKFLTSSEAFYNFARK